MYLSLMEKEDSFNHISNLHLNYFSMVMVFKENLILHHLLPVSMGLRVVFITAGTHQ